VADLTASVSVAVLSQDPDWLALLQLRTADGASVIMVFSDKNRHLGFQLGVGGPIFSSDVVIADKKWHSLEVHIRTGDAGVVEISLDGAKIPTLSGPQPLSNQAIGVVELGSVSARHTFDAVFDDVSIARGKTKAKSGVRSARAISTPVATAISRSDDPVLHWLPEIAAASKATGVPPSLIAGVIALESSGDPSIVSVAGAVGLMQVMPDELAAHGVNYVDGFDPATNIMTGARILAERAGAGWELAAGYYFGIGCDAYGTCTGAYVRAALSWAAAYAPALDDPFRGDPSVIPESWNMNPATPTETPTKTPTEIATPTKTPNATKTSTVAASSTVTPSASPTEEASTVATEPPTSLATDVPTDTPTEIPTDVPTETPTEIPTEVPTEVPTEEPTDIPADTPTEVPADEGTVPAG